MNKSDQKTMINGAKVVDKHITPEINDAIEALLRTEITADAIPFLRTAIKIIVTLAVLNAKEQTVDEMATNPSKFKS